MSVAERRGKTPDQQILDNGLGKLRRRAFELVAMDMDLRDRLRHLSDDVPAFYDISTGQVVVIRYGTPKKEDDIYKVKVIPVVYEKIGDAIAAMDIVGKSYDPEKGDETNKDRSALNVAREERDYWLNTPVSEEERQVMEQGVLDFIQEAKLDKPINPDRKSIRDSLISGIGSGTLPQPNPPARLTQVALAETTAQFRVGDVDAKVFKKYDQDMRRVLNEERKNTLDNIESVRDLMRFLDRLDSLTPKGYARDFEKATDWVLSKLLERLGRHAVRVAPFRRRAQEILAASFRDLGEMPEEEMKMVLGDEVYDDYKGIVPLDEYFDFFAPVEARAKVVQFERGLRRELRDLVASESKSFTAAKKRAREIIAERRRKAA